MKQTKLILVGGFLGAGKTSMLKKAAEILREEGKAVGLITNDQATNLVDTSLLLSDGNIVREVSGSCFCCNFPGFAEAVEYVAEEIGGGITIAEPVGSCTDLSATIMQPLKDQYKDLADTAPLTVLADPERLQGILDKKYSTAAYIVTKQFDEADVILINKIDTLDQAQCEELLKRTRERWPNAMVMAVSVKEGTGVAEWLSYILAESGAGKNLATVDYDIYADGEAAYGWLNATYAFMPGKGDCESAARGLLDLLETGLAEDKTGIGHVKFLLQDTEKQWIGNLTGGAAPSMLRSDDKRSEEVYLTVNARAEIGPKELQDQVLSAINQAFADFTCVGTDIRTLIPGRPNPTYHYDEIVK